MDLSIPSATKPPAARLFVLLARRRQRALILRRGPSDWYHLIAWDTAQDSFQHGAWFRGRIYEERCDLSPDGELLVYMALQGSRYATTYEGAWTAVSRAPWLHALGLWPQGDTWGGGGYFLDDRRLVLARSDVVAHPDHVISGVEVTAGPPLRNAASPALEGSEWSGLDQAGWPVFARAGKLFRRTPQGDVELADFNALTPQPEPAPDWAKAPLRGAPRPTKAAKRSKARKRRSK